MKGECVSAKDYKHSVKVWNTFEMKIMGDYQVLHLKLDVLLLAGVFKKFISVCI